MNIKELLDVKEYDAIMSMMAKLSNGFGRSYKGKELDDLPLQNVMKGIKYYLSATDDTFSNIEKSFAHAGLKKMQKKLMEGKSIVEKIDGYLEENWGEQIKSKDDRPKSDIVCLECGKKFKKKISSFSEIKCPKCGSYDTEIG